MPLNNDIELRCEEVQEIMNRIPPSIQRWGIIVITFTITVLFAIASFVKLPITEDCIFVMTWNGDTNKNTISLSPSILQLVLSNDTTDVLLHSDLFPSEYSSGISTFFTKDQISINPKGNYEATFRISPEVENCLSEKHLSISGKATIFVTNKTLLYTLKICR